MARYIEADALRKEFSERPPDYYSTGYILDTIDEHPALSPDEVRGVGEWIWHDKYGWDDSLECSCCAEEFVVYDGEFPGIDSFKFCPNCGARMEVSEDA